MNEHVMIPVRENDIEGWTSIHSSLVVATVITLLSPSSALLVPPSVSAHLQFHRVCNSFSERVLTITMLHLVAYHI